MKQLKKKKVIVETEFYHTFEERSKNGQPEELFTCAYCEHVGPRKDFYKGSTENSVMHVCSKCHKKRSKVVTRLKKSNPPPGDGYICPISGKTVENIRGNAWVLDHDHKTEEFRGYLSHNANVAIGFLNDDPVQLLKAAIYLLSHKSKTLPHGLFGNVEF